MNNNRKNNEDSFNYLRKCVSRYIYYSVNDKQNKTRLLKKIPVR
jgi:hypothetical protein